MGIEEEEEEEEKYEKETEEEGDHHHGEEEEQEQQTKNNEKEEGVVVLRDTRDRLIKAVIDNITVLSLDKGGCVTLPRVLQLLPPSRREEALNRLLSSDPDVATRPYANYVIQYFVEGGRGENGLGTETKADENVDDNDNDNDNENRNNTTTRRGGEVAPTRTDVCHRLITKELSDMETLVRWGCSKCGSQVIDRLLHHAAPPDARLLLSYIFSPSALHILGTHQFGHYNVKSAFTRLLLMVAAEEENQKNNNNNNTNNNNNNNDNTTNSEGSAHALLLNYYRIAHQKLKRTRFARWVLRKAKETLMRRNEMGVVGVVTGRRGGGRGGRGETIPTTHSTITTNNNTTTANNNTTITTHNNSNNDLTSLYNNSLGCRPEAPSRLLPSSSFSSFPLSCSFPNSPFHPHHSHPPPVLSLPSFFSSHTTLSPPPPIVRCSYEQLAQIFTPSSSHLDT